jgi:hypothetical protein
MLIQVIFDLAKFMFGFSVLDLFVVFTVHVNLVC